MQNEIGRLRRRFRQQRAELFGLDALKLPCRDLLERHTALVDGIVSDIYDFSCRVAEQEIRRSPRSGLAIVATGGYGRRELNPFSDIDIAFIPSEEEDPWVEAAVHTAFKLVMDVFLSFRKIRVGYSYRPLAEVPTWDLATLTSLLDARHLCGEVRLSEALAVELPKVLSPLDLLLECERELERWKNDPSRSLYGVEPNLKQGPGSLRDLHRARWIYRLLLKRDDADLLTALEKQQYLPAGKAVQIEAAAEWFWNARDWLHLKTGRCSDVLINNYQDQIAAELTGESAQDWLSQHYTHAETLALFRASALRNARQGPLDLGGVLLECGNLHLRRESRVAATGSAVRLFHLSQKYGLPLSSAELTLLEAQQADAARVETPNPEESWAFLRILNGERNIGATIRAMANVRLMERFVSGFSRLMRFVPPDPAHSYTVGEHSLKIVEYLERLRAGQENSVPRFCELINSCAHFDMLCLGALLHDSGKLLAGSDHSEAATALTRCVVEHLELPAEKREIVQTLVRHHLLLVRTARLQDLKSPGVIHDVAEKVRSIEALRHLYVFTYADTRSVAEKNWTSMDFRNLEDLYGKVHSFLSGRSTEESDSVAVEERIGEIRRKLLSSGPLDDDAVGRHCDAMPASYVLNTPLDEIAFHIQLLQRLESEMLVLDIYNRPGDDYSELTVCTYDDPRPGMLAKIAGVLYGCNTDIHRAQVFTLESARPVVLDTLWVRAGGMQLSEIRAARVRSSLREVLTGASTVERFLTTVGKQPPVGIPLDSVELRNDLSEEHTVVHVIARDVQGLLYLMTRTLSRSGLHIHSAKVATWNARAENNFYVTTLDGGQIPGSDLALWRDQITKLLRGLSSE